LRFGDINVDGYPDIYLTLTLEDTKNNTINRSMVLMNIPCTDKICSTVSTKPTPDYLQSKMYKVSPKATVLPRRYFNITDNTG